MLFSTLRDRATMTLVPLLQFPRRQRTALTVSLPNIVFSHFSKLSKVTEDIYALVQELREETGIGSLKVTYGAKRGYHLSAKVLHFYQFIHTSRTARHAKTNTMPDQVDPSTLPPFFVTVSQAGKSGTTTFTTAEVASLASRHTDAVQEIYLLTGKSLKFNALLTCR